MKSSTTLRQLAARALGRRRPLPAVKAYALWADNYPPSPHNPLMHAEQSVMVPIIQSTSPQRALDAGTGSGRYLPLLASTGARVVIGVDLSLPMLVSRARDAGPKTASKADHKNLLQPSPSRPWKMSSVARVCGDVRRLPFADASFDLISSSLMVGDMADLDGWVSEAARVLTPGGHLVYSDFHPSWAAKRWQRTFQAADGRSFEIAYFPHTLADHVTALGRRFFDIRAIGEPGLTVPGAAGAHATDVPVAIVFHAVKLG
jgi:SAM-dependent methyltransferase